MEKGLWGLRLKIMQAYGAARERIRIEGDRRCEKGLVDQEAQKLCTKCTGPEKRELSLGNHLG